MPAILYFPKVTYIVDWNIPFAKYHSAGSQHSVLFRFHVLSLSFIMQWIPVFQMLAEIAITVV